MENIHEIPDCHVINISEIPECSECHVINVHEIAECHAINVEVLQHSESERERENHTFIPGMLRTNIIVSGLSGLDVVNNGHFRGGGLIFTLANMDSHSTRVCIGCGIITSIIAFIYYMVHM
jgi:hypothetical protein